jgi:hypothetical protein
LGRISCVNRTFKQGDSSQNDCYRKYWGKIGRKSKKCGPEKEGAGIINIHRIIKKKKRKMRGKIKGVGGEVEWRLVAINYTSTILPLHIPCVYY